jgi:polyribonucleotide nucleotidyltransferase
MSRSSRKSFLLTIQGHSARVEARTLQSAVHKAAKSLIKDGKIEDKPRWDGTDWLGVNVIEPEITTSDVQVIDSSALFARGSSSFLQRLPSTRESEYGESKGKR